MEDKNVMTSSVMTQIDAVRHDVADKTSGLVVTAMGLLGVPYRRGGTSAETGFDCSGFVRAIYSQTIGLVLPRRANEQAAATQTIDKKELQPGDLVFFNTMRRTFSHVGIYIGDGKFVHSPRTGETVRVEDMQAAYWKKRFNGARRVVDYSLTTQAQ
ncbi:C40 family peptidase [Simplicispira psychrophila]|uniref:C40 family peptidase n=1 Tax=Simplicispira psychrophila TaxID=80882 RepID=UPI003CCBCF7E